MVHDWYRPDYYEQLAKQVCLTIIRQDRTRPSIHPPNEKSVSIAAAHFFAMTNIARATLVGTRGKGEINTGTNHLGFRLCEIAGKQREADGPNQIAAHLPGRGGICYCSLLGSRL